MDERILGILVHQLPEELKNDALELFSRESVSSVKQDETGLRICFKQYNSVQENILRKRVIVRGTLYEIYPLVTNLTIHGIRPCARRSEIRELMKLYGTIIDLYPAHNVHHQLGYKTVYLTDDYRIILDIPEVLASYRLEPVIDPDTFTQFRVTFFCRLCRKNGHKQYQCLSTLGTLGTISPESVLSFKRQLSSASEQSEVSESSYCQNNGDCHDDDHSHYYSTSKIGETSNEGGFSHLNKQQKDTSNCNHNFSYPMSLPKKLSNNFRKDRRSLKDKRARFEFSSNDKRLSPVETSFSETYKDHEPEQWIDTSNCKQNFSYPVSLRKKLSNDFKIYTESVNDKSDRYEFSSSGKRLSPVETSYSETHKGNKLNDRKDTNSYKQNISYPVSLSKNLPNDSKKDVISSKNKRALYESSSSDKQLSPEETSCSETHKGNNLKDRKDTNSYKQNISYPVSLPKKLPNDLKKDTKSSKDKRALCEFSSEKQLSPVDSSHLEIYEDTYLKSILTAQISQVDTDSKALAPSAELPTEKRKIVEADQISRNKVKKRVAPQLASMTPPGSRIQDVKKLIRDAIECGAHDLPLDVEGSLRQFLEWNESGSGSNLGKKELRLLRWIRLVLAKAADRRSVKPRDMDPDEKSESSSTNEEKRENSQTSDAADKAQTSKRPRSKKTSISPGITEAVLKTNGVLESRLLLNFLLQVRGRKKYLDVIEHFTKDIRALADQLHEVIGVYFRSGKKGVDEDRDVQWIKGLCKRIEGSERFDLKTCIKTEHGSPQQLISGNQSSSADTERKTIRRSSTPISPGIFEAISNLHHGELSPQQLSNFLGHVRGRKNILNVANHFTSNTGALVNQLKDVMSAYFCSGKRCPSDAKDIHWIDRLCKRLDEQRKNTPGEMCIETGKNDFKGNSEYSELTKHELIGIKVEPMDYD